MGKISTPSSTNPRADADTGEPSAEVTGIYLNKYQEIVKPNQRFLIPNYFIHYWVNRLGPTLAWIVISLQQACWRADDDHCTIAQLVIGEEIGIHRHTVSKELHNNPLRHWYIPEVQIQPGIINYKDKTYQPLPSKYTVYLSTPLIPEHLAGLYRYFQKVCPHGQTLEIEQAIDNLLGLKSKDALALLDMQARETEQQFETPLPVVQAVAMATGLDLETLPEDKAKTLDQKLAGLETHLTEISSTICRQYFRVNWVPILGPAMAWLVMIFRSRCYYNQETGELRDVCLWKKKDIAAMLGQSNQNLRRLLSHKYAGHFFQIVDNQKHKMIVRTAMVQEPLTTESATEFWDRQPDLGKKPRNATILDMTPPQNATILDMTPPENATILDITSSKTQQISTSPPENATNFDTCKYFKESVPTVDNGHENTIQNNDVVVDNSKDKIKKLLLNAGLSGTGLSKLSNKNPPLDPKQVQAAILYAEANKLGPGYIYRHLERDDSAIDELFMQFAALDDETLGLFREAVGELKVNGTFTSEIRTPIPEAKIDLFAKFAEIFAGIEASRVSAILCHRQQSIEQVYPDEPTLDEADPFDTSSGRRAGPADEPAYVTTLPACPEHSRRERNYSLDTFWQQVLGQLQLQMTQGTFDTWLKGTRLIARDGLRFTVEVKNDFAKDWLENRLFRTVQRTIANLVESDAEHNPALRPPKGEVSNGQEVPDVEIDFVVDGS
jgi:hypothetical protein